MFHMEHYDKSPQNFLFVHRSYAISPLSDHVVIPIIVQNTANNFRIEWFKFRAKNAVIAVATTSILNEEIGSCKRKVYGILSYRWYYYLSKDILPGRS